LGKRCVVEGRTTRDAKGRATGGAQRKTKILEIKETIAEPSPIDVFNRVVAASEQPKK
jgi:hypothetical protein